MSLSICNKTSSTLDQYAEGENRPPNALACQSWRLVFIAPLSHSLWFSALVCARLACDMTFLGTVVGCNRECLGANPTTASSLIGAQTPEATIHRKAPTFPPIWSCKEKTVPEHSTVRRIICKWQWPELAEYRHWKTNGAAKQNYFWQLEQRG